MSKCSDALRLGIKAGIAHFIVVETCGQLVTLCDPSLTPAIPERPRDEHKLIIIRCYKNYALLCSRNFWKVPGKRCILVHFHRQMAMFGECHTGKL